MKYFLLKIFAFIIINYIFLLISPLNHVSDNSDLNSSKNDTVNNSSGSHNNFTTNYSKNIILQSTLQLIEQAFNFLADRIGTSTSSIGLCASVAGTAAAVACVLIKDTIPLVQKVSYSATGALIGGNNQVAASSVVKILKKTIVNVSLSDSPDIPPLATDIIYSMDEDLLLHPMEGLINSILIYNVVILILSFYLLFNILVLIFSNQIEKKINKVSTNNNFFFNFILKTIKGISVRSSIINIIIIYIIF